MKTIGSGASALVFFCFMILATNGAWGGDNGNGTLKIGSRIWLKQTDCGGKMTWADAGTKANNLAAGQTCNISDGSKTGDWRVPTIAELASLAEHTSEFGTLQSAYWSSTESVVPFLKGAALWNPDKPTEITHYDSKSTPHYVLFIHK